MELFLDTETTGFSHDKDRIVDIAIVDASGRVLLDTLVNPNRKIPHYASDVHGITDEMVKGMPNIYKLMPKIKKIVDGNDVIAYNAPFDVGFFPNKLKNAASINCAMRVFAEFQGSSKPLKLGVAADMVGHVWSGVAHRALADTLACKSVWDATAESRKAGLLNSALKKIKPPEITYPDKAGQWAADSMKRFMDKFLNKKMDEEALLRVILSEAFLLAIETMKLDEEELAELINRSMVDAKNSVKVST